MRVDLKSLTLAAFTALGSGVSAGVAADATTPVDYRARNETYAPAESVPRAKQKPAQNSRVQDKRVDQPTIEKRISPLGERPRAFEVKEEGRKNVREKDARRPESVEPATSALSRRPATISTASDTTKPPRVARYQDSLAAASATNMARFPALDGATTAKINRFVFRKNPAEPAAGVNGSRVVPAAGGSVPK